ncbi:MAG TPA: bestrophin family ion channel [Puia sp.]|nr:bestrophin family ion channel [Puia sp.]
MLLEKKIPARYLLQAIRIELPIIVLLSLTINYIAWHFKHLLPDMPLGIPAFLGTAISVLLSFRLNQSYDRWWEARKVWGAIVNISRSLVLQLQGLVKDDSDPAIKKIAFLQIAWCYSLGQSLRGLDPLENTQPYLTNTERGAVKNHANKPLAILQLNAAAIKELRNREQLNPYSHVQLDNTLIRLSDAMGAAERINNTIFPSTYRKLLHVVIYLFVVTLSIALKEVGTVFAIPLLILISGCFFLLEKTASQLKDPFRNQPSDTSVTAITRTIEINILQLLGEAEIPAPITPESFYIM